MPKSKRNVGLPERQLTRVAISNLTPDPTNPRKHSTAQIGAIARSIEAFGFNAPILVNKENQIVVGHGRYAAAKLLGHTEIEVIRLEHLNEAQARAYMLADNKLTDRSSWDDPVLAVHLKELSELVLEFEIEDTGFEPPEIDFRIQSLDEAEDSEPYDEFQLAKGPAVSALGDLWFLGDHRVYCGNALEPAAYQRLFEHDDRKAAAVFTDPPYNVPIDGHVSGNGRTVHREFAMATGEMSVAEFTEFLKGSCTHIKNHTTGGALIYMCMDWRHMMELQSAGQSTGWDLVNLCVWAKSNGGMGSLYRSRHELIFVFRNGEEPHVNNIQLGRFGRNRTNVWNYAGANTFAQRRASSLHPTVKPVLMVADAILDSTKRDDIVLDPYLGSGTTLLAANRTRRRCYGIELDPLYVDTVVERWQRASGLKAHNHVGETLERVRTKRRAGP